MVRKIKNSGYGRLIIGNQLSIIKLLLVWRLFLFALLFLGVGMLPLQMNFLGGGVDNYLKSPQLWAWANFDGEHYLAIAKFGYQPLTYFFFPLYPILLGYFEKFFGGDVSYLFSGLLVSHISFLIGLYIFVKLIRLDFKESIVNLSLILLLAFPTSLFFGSVYTESLFFALVISSLYFARKRYYLLAGVLGGLATATRITGLALIPAFLAEYFFVSQKNLEAGRHLKFSLVKAISIVLCFSGILLYMFYLNRATGNSLEFFHNLGAVFGEQRSSYLVPLPQVFYRYFFKILPNINYDYFPVIFMTYLEIVTGTIFFVLSIISFWKLRLSYSLFLLCAYLIPTFSGSFSSFPRYALVLFPAFILVALYLEKRSMFFKAVLFSALLVGSAISTILFTRGYWLS